VSDVAAKLEAMIRRVIREEVPPLLERLADEDQERRARRLALRLEGDPAKLTDDEAARLRAWLAANRASCPAGDRTPERWLNGKTARPRRATVARWWTAKLGRPEPELIALLEDDGDEAAASGPPEREGAAV